MGDENEGGKWPRHGDDFDATMNTNRIQGDGGKRSIDSGFTVRDAGVGPLEDLYCFVLRVKARMMNILSIIKHNGL